MQNGDVESFNGKLGDEYLNERWFMPLVQARDVTASGGGLQRSQAAATAAASRPPSSLPATVPNPATQTGKWG